MHVVTISFHSPKGAFLVWIHEGPSGAAEGVTELQEVPQCCEDPDAAGGVGVGQHLVRLVLRAVVAAPNLAVRQNIYHEIWKK